MSLFAGGLGNASPKNFYSILGLTKDATGSEIKKAYHAMALKYHPDKHTNATEDEREEYEQMFVEASLAYEILHDSDTRQRYDLGEDFSNNKGTNTPQPYGRDYLHDPFNLYVRWKGGAFELKYKPSEDRVMGEIIVYVDLTLEELMAGATKNVTYEAQRMCTACAGTGAKDEKQHTCSHCNGTGQKLHLFANKGEGSSAGEDHTCHLHHDHGHYRHVVNASCTTCEGSGALPDEQCPVCAGTRHVTETIFREVQIPKGVRPGFKLSFEGEGHRAHRHKNGNLIIVISLIPHLRFELDEKDVIYRTKVSLLDALMGFRKKLTYFSGMTLTVEQRLHKFRGHRQTVLGLGLPPAPDGSKAGDLVIIYDVVFPYFLNAEMRRKLKTVLHEDVVDMLEDVIRLQREGVKSFAARMHPEELNYCDSCSEDPTICVINPKYWTWPFKTIKLRSPAGATGER